MSQQIMDCAEIRDALLSGSAPAGPGVEAHVRECEACAELLRDRGELGKALSRGEAPSQPNPDLWSSLEGALRAESGPRAWLRSRATPVRLLIAALVASAIVTYGGRAAEGGVAPAERPLVWLVAFTLVGFACLSVLVAPLGRPRPPPGVRLAIVLAALALPLLYASSSVASLAPASPQQFTFAEQALGCFAYGTFLVLPFLFVVWALDRGERPFLGLVAGVGAVAGLVANVALALHCPNTEPAHIAAGHATIGGALASLGALVVLVTSKFRS